MDKCTRAIPTVHEVEAELQRVQYQERYRRTLRSTLCILISVAAVIVLISALVLPVFRTHGTGMYPTLEDGQLVVVWRTAPIAHGDVVCFYYNNKVLIKRVIAVGGDTVDINWKGEVTVNGKPLEEPYLKETAFGECNISLPYVVPPDRLFVMGDNRGTSVDSRHIEVGCVSAEQIIGKLLWRIWPPEAVSAIH